MKIVVSACLLGENCKYDGGNNYSLPLEMFLAGHEVTGVCPEVLGGLSIPRKPSEIVDGVVRQRDGTSVDEEFRIGAKKALEIVREQAAELVVLQSRSPSCGVGYIYDGTFSKTLVPGNGVFAEMLKKEGISVLDVEDLP